MKTMRTAVMLAAMAMCGAASAIDYCPKLEFAELESLPKEQLLQMRCEYRLKSVELGSDRCSSEVTKMDRIVARKYELKDKGNPAIPYYAEVSRMCDQPHASK